MNPFDIDDKEHQKLMKDVKNYIINELPDKIIIREVNFGYNETGLRRLSVMAVINDNYISLSIPIEKFEEWRLEKNRI